MSSILQPWVEALGLRHQGVLLTAVRGCDTAARHDPSKLLARCLRNEILRAHCGDSAKAKSFIEAVPLSELVTRMKNFLNNADQYPVHYVLHLYHAAEVIGYHHPDISVRMVWSDFYRTACEKMHVQPETMAMLDARLSASEDVFAARQDVKIDCAEGD